jgi:hypothetical protein
MPFTPAHTAFVLPFIRSRYASATGLLVGSVAPDFEYFFKMSVDGVHGHTWAGLFYFDLPVSLLLAYLFHLLIKKNLVSNLPVFLQHRFHTLLNFDFHYFMRRHYLKFLISVLVGSASHIIWDGFTHGTGYFVHYFDFYEGTYVPFQGVNYPLWYALQHFSTFIGLVLVVIYVLFLPKESGTVAAPRWAYWGMLLAITLSCLAIRFAIYSSDLNEGNVVVSLISGLCVALVCAGLVQFRYETMQIDSK